MTEHDSVLLSINDVCKDYPDGNVRALDHVSFEIGSGEYVAIMGPSGSGKSTLLSILGTLDQPTSGTISFEGKVLDGSTDLDALRSQSIGFVFQSFNLVTWMSACENVQIPLMLAGKPAAEQRARALELLDRVVLSDRADHLPSELSQGQQQRVALARTLANDPQVILADEPTGNLDSGTRQQVMNYLTEFHNDGRTIVMVTHDADTAAFAKRTIRLVEGVTNEVMVAEAA